MSFFCKERDELFSVILQKAAFSIPLACLTTDTGVDKYDLSCTIKSVQRFKRNNNTRDGNSSVNGIYWFVNTVYGSKKNHSDSNTLRIALSPIEYSTSKL